MMGAALALQIIQNCAGAVGLLGNSIVCVAICKVSALHTLTNGFILNQAIIDLLGSLLSVTSANVSPLVPVPAGYRGEVYCRLWYSNFFVWVFFSASTFSLVALTLERYLAILYPFVYEAKFNKNVSIVCIVVIWVLGFASGAYNLINVQFDGVDSCEHVNIVGSQLVGVLLFLFEYAIPVSVMLYAYIHITVALKRSARRVAAIGTSIHSGSDQGQAGSLVRARKNVFKTLFIVFCSFVVCWTPNKIIFLMFNFGWPLDFAGALYVVSVALVVSNSAINPIIYALKYRQFRRGLRTLFGLPQPRDEELGNSSTQRPERGVNS